MNHSGFPNPSCFIERAIFESCYAEDAEPSEIILKDKTLSLAYDNKIKKDVSYFSKRMVLVDL
ncbi:MAG: hypothetical protein M1382_02835, partial [Candidatus Marsarchaeota archaeon]|nr:hypothetical protein [Candidatus Marsarchaeota archaeon]